jgi:glycosyltransferase involved in cell wall biosynthesis
MRSLEQSSGQRPVLVRPTARVAFVSTYPPAVCGLASFTESLCGALALNRGSRDGIDVVELVEDPRVPHNDRPEVIARLDPADPFSIRKTAERLDGHDIVVLQHEYGIWGPDMGRAVVEFADAIQGGLITTLHTLLPQPGRLQEKIIRGLSDRSLFTVVQTRSAGELLASGYGVNPSAIVVIPHGTGRSLRSVAHARSTLVSQGSQHLLTWGLIGPGKGLEWSLRAVGQLKESYPDIHYTIAGRTHPKVLAREGEEYRELLLSIVSRLGLEDNVEFIDSYLSQDLLNELLLDTTIAVLPYDSTDQMVSGVLVEAVSATVPVVATSFPHAIELAGSGAALAVPHRSPHALANAIRSLLDSETALAGMVEAQDRIATGLEWSNVARDYDRLIGAAVRARSLASHVPTAS